MPFNDCYRVRCAMAAGGRTTPLIASGSRVKLNSRVVKQDHARRAISVPGSAPRHIEYGTSIESTGVGAEPRNHVRNLIRGSEALQRAVADHRLDRFRAKIADHVDIDGARRNAVHEYPTIGDFSSQRLRERDDACACCRIRRQSGEPFFACQ